jgi:hypothetical protein
MKSAKLKAKKNLPEHFQEVLITHEIQFENGDLTVDLIRKLIYLYSVYIYKYS